MLQSPLRTPLIEGSKTYQSITSDILNPMMNKAGKFWYMGMTIAGLATAVWIIHDFLDCLAGNRYLGRKQNSRLGF